MFFNTTPPTVSWGGLSGQDEDYRAAAALAFELGQAGRLLGVVEAALGKGPDEAQAILGPLVAGLGPEQLRQCLQFAREWNTNSRRCHAAQATLQAVMLQHPPEARSRDHPACVARSAITPSLDTALSSPSARWLQLACLVRGTAMLQPGQGCCQGSRQVCRPMLHLFVNASSHSCWLLCSCTPCPAAPVARALSQLRGALAELLIAAAVSSCAQLGSTPGVAVAQSLGLS